MKMPFRRMLVPLVFFLGGVVLILLLLEISLRVAACAYVYINHARIPAVSKDHSRTVVACFGDSFTECGHSLYKDRYPAQLQRMFDAAGEKVEVVNYGVCESNSTQVRRRMEQVVKGRHLDYAVLLVGATNRYNFIGFNDSRVMCFFKGLRVCRLAHVFRIYIRDRLLRMRAENMVYDFETIGTGFREPIEADLETMALKDPQKGYLLWVRHYIMQGRFSDAMGILRQAIAEGKNTPEIKSNMGECYEGLGDYAAAERVYSELKEEFPENGYLVLGQFYARQGKHAMAERLLQEAVRYDAKEGYLELGKFYRDRKRYAQAEESFKRAAGYKFFEADLSLLELYAECGRYEETEEKYDEILARYPGEFTTNFTVEYYTTRGMYADAIRCFLKAIDQPTPPDMLPFFLMTSVFSLQSQYTAHDVLTVMNRAVARNPFLARQPTFCAYKEYFQDVNGWERKRGKWLNDDLEKMTALCRQEGVPLVILNYPMTFSRANELLYAVARRHGLPFIDLNSQFSAAVERDGNAKYFQPGNLHCTPEGYHIMADNVFRMIRSLRAVHMKGS